MGIKISCSIRVAFISAYEERSIPYDRRPNKHEEMGGLNGE